MPEKTGLSGKCSLTVGWSKLSAPLADSGERFAFFALSLMIGRSPRHRACLAAALILFISAGLSARKRLSCGDGMVSTVEVDGDASDACCSDGAALTTKRESWPPPAVKRST